MRKSCSRAGFTLMESMAALAAAAVVLLAYISLHGLSGRTLSETQIRSSLETIRNDLRTRVSDGEQLCANLYENYVQEKTYSLTYGSSQWTGLGCVWKKVSTLAVPSNPSSPDPRSIICNQYSFSGIPTAWWDTSGSAGCKALATDGNPWPGGQFSSNHCDVAHGCPFILYDLNSAMNGSAQPYYDSTDSTAGFTLEGIPCHGFDPTNGNSACPLRYALNWKLECKSSDYSPAGQNCSCHTLVISAELQVKFPANDPSGNSWMNNLNKQDNANTSTSSSANTGNTEVGFPTIRVPIERCTSS